MILSGTIRVILLVDQASNDKPIPSVDQVLNFESIRPLMSEYGRDLVVDQVRAVLNQVRTALGPNVRSQMVDQVELSTRIKDSLEALLANPLKPVFNLTGTVIHTNLGRAPLPRLALDAMAAISGTASNLEFDLTKGKRGDRDTHIENLLCRLTGAEAATVVNNDAAAVLLTLNTLALRKEVLVSRGELIEIGGSFRMPDIMARAGCKLKEVGTTNRTHARDYKDAIGPRTALLMKVHTSNYEVRGFTKDVDANGLSEVAHRADLPVVVDLGSGSLVDLTVFGLPQEPTVADTVQAGADLVTFSGDKLLGGPQAGWIVGRADLVAKLKRNPMKRALRVDKTTLAALFEVLKLYTNPERLPEHLPVLKLLTRPVDKIEALAQRLIPVVAQVIGQNFSVEAFACRSQIGSGALPTEELDSFGLALRPLSAKADARLRKLAAAFRALPMPVIGRLHDGALVFDMRCLEDEQAFVTQLTKLTLPKS